MSRTSSQSGGNSPSMPEKPAPPPKISEVPDASGLFGPFGGTHVPEVLVQPLKAIADAYIASLRDERFWDEWRDLQKSFVGHPTPLHHASRLMNAARRGGGGGETARVFLKRMDQCHTGSMAINATLGQAMLAKKMGRQRVIAPTSSGEHGVALAAVATMLGLSCEVYIGAPESSQRRQAIARMNAFGARVHTVENATLAGAMSAAFEAWATDTARTSIVVGGAVGPHPFPTIVRDFQAHVGTETKAQSLRLFTKLPDVIVATAGGENDAAGLFYPFVDDDKVQLVGVEGGGRGAGTGDHAAPLSHGRVCEMHGMRTSAMQDEIAGPLPTHSIAGGLNYAAGGPEHVYWRDLKRVRYAAVTDARALEAFELLARSEGIIPSLESAHAVAESIEVASKLKSDQNVVVCISGSGEWAVEDVAKMRN